MGYRARPLGFGALLTSTGVVNWGWGFSVKMLKGRGVKKTTLPHSGNGASDLPHRPLLPSTPEAQPRPAPPAHLPSGQAPACLGTCWSICPGRGMEAPEPHWGWGSSRLTDLALQLPASAERERERVASTVG